MNILASIWHGLEFVATQLVAVVGINLSIEQPSFEILHQLSDSVEIRQYPARIIAETTVELNGSDGTLTPEEASSQGFRRIAGYIFGANLSQSGTKKSANELIPMTAPVEMSSQSIAMTAPVEISSGSVMTMRFVMPSSYQIETLPIPNDPRVIIRSLPGETLAVLRYSGRRKPKTIARKAEALTATIASSDWRIVTTTPLREFYYNPPWTVPIFRHNEVAFAVELKP